jgi:NAD(P)H-dependent glutamate synthase small subunit
MAVQADDPVGSMGTDTPLAVLSRKPKLLFNYFKQNFAQVTNPPIDPIREELVMSLVSMIGPRPNLLGHQAGNHKRLEVSQPILTNTDLEKIRSIAQLVDGAFRTVTVDCTWPVAQGATGLEAAIARICLEATDAVLADNNILILSDRAVSAERVPVPAALATAAVHHNLIRQGLRMQTGLVIETGEAREVHHFCVLAGYGAEAINPYLAFETLERLRTERGFSQTAYEVRKNYIKAIGKGLLKVMSKMGISTYQSYCGAQIFDAVGLSSALVEKYFTGTATTIEGAGLKEIAEEALRRHGTAFGEELIYRNMLDVGGDYAFRIRGEDHAWTPDTVANLQHAVRGNLPDAYRAFADAINEQSERLLTIRGLMSFQWAAEPLPLDQVEPASEIVKRFATGAMSFGSISREAHTTLAIAMNRIGGRSNTGEGGEETDRFKPLPNGDSMRSAIKQVASGRFGVTTEYLVNADDIQIKMAQGAKPGEGGQLPGHKVDKNIARVRHSTPGVGLISPPPHHDIYSIEDLGQLIYDLKSVNPKARISVKLVSEVGVGTVAAGVAKARADHVTISGYEGGTGASPLTSLTHAGSPWEIGLAETQQTLVLNSLRGRIAVQVDGGLRTGRDVAIGALLGADEFGFATAPLIAAGCIMMRKCHLNTCPVGVATQDPVLRKRFTGQPEHVINYFFFVAEELRAIMAKLGFKTLGEMIGRVDKLDMRDAHSHWKAKGLDLSKILHQVLPPPGVAIYNSERQKHMVDQALDNELIAATQSALETRLPIQLDRRIRNVDRTVGAMLSGEVAKRYGHAGLPDGTIHVRFTGTAGQSFGAFLAHGVFIELAGDGNDYVGKGLSGGRVVVGQPAGSHVDPTENIIVGNTVLYGAIAGEAYFEGVAGERFAVRNSGAVAVVEGVGDHGCEYMTGGVVVVLGKTGRNFAAGMSGGIAYVYDPDATFATRVNPAMVKLEAIAPEVQTPDDAGMPRDLKLDLGDNGMGDVLQFDAERLHMLIARHHRYTGSARAKQLLDNWHEARTKFVKVMPLDYARALTEQKNEHLRDSSRIVPRVWSITMGKPTGFLEIERCDRGYEKPETRSANWREFVKPLAYAEVGRQAARCMDCGIPFCHQGCPVNNLIPDWNNLAYRDDWRTALDVLHSTNNFPEFTGRVCPAPCEASCTLNIDDNPVTIKTIECQIVDRGWTEGWIVPQTPPDGSGKTVAVIGSGPAGLACAQQLARAGHHAVVFEKSDRAGGLLRYGIPDFKMEKHLIDRRLAQMEAEGVEFRCGENVGVSLPFSMLLADFDAVVMAGGAEEPRNLDIEGRALSGVHFAMDFLRQQNKRGAGDTEDVAAPGGTITAKDKHVVVIGGGDTGSDCIGTSVRQGAASITQLEILPKPPEHENKALTWPDWPLKLRTSSSQEEGCERDWSVVTKRAVEFDGRIAALECVRVEWVKGANGATQMQEIADSAFQLKADLVLLAMGFTGPVLPGLVEQAGVQQDARGNVKANMTDYKTSEAKIFACGDMRRGQSLVVWAIREGRQCARAVDEFLMGATSLPR